MSEEFFIKAALGIAMAAVPAALVYKSFVVQQDPCERAAASYAIGYNTAPSAPELSYLRDKARAACEAKGRRVEDVIATYLPPASAASAATR